MSRLLPIAVRNVVYQAYARTDAARVRYARPYRPVSCFVEFPQASNIDTDLVIHMQQIDHPSFHGSAPPSAARNQGCAGNFANWRNAQQAIMMVQIHIRPAGNAIILSPAIDDLVNHAATVRQPPFKGTGSDASCGTLDARPVPVPPYQFIRGAETRHIRLCTAEGVALHMLQHVDDRRRRTGLRPAPPSAITDAGPGMQNSRPSDSTIGQAPASSPEYPGEMLTSNRAMW